MAKNLVKSERADVWALWDKLKRLFPTWSLLPEAFYTPGAWGYVGVDFVSGFRKNASTLKTFDLLKDVDDARFDALSALANLNARRQEQLLRAVVVGYLTLPLTITALAADLAGDSVMGLLREHTTAAIQIGATITLGPLGYFLSHWRSRQIVGVLDLIRIERGQTPFTALELREE
ncbi:hypothetical protein [Caulobacter sp. BE254]|uniref:hypothetical protein n=1 Tax=Caulobacter sp. BE254 TaxID=2817720 RepID=UPI00286458B1|nr:hypothetical protein [Caulobacter sp. BE254]MDR7117570.1 hypothetical protein [Caulobacter sp. BE254]